MNPAFAIAEVVWILLGRNDSKFLNFWNPKLPQYCGNGLTYHGAYGYRLRHGAGGDQLERAYQALKSNKDSRQVVLQIWDTTCDMPNPDGSPQSKDIPCNIAAMLKVRGGALEWMQVMRSNDLFLGTPHNFIQWTSLQEVLAGWLSCKVGSFVLVTDSLHLYEHDSGKCSMTDIAPRATNTDSLALPKKDFDELIVTIGKAMDELIEPELTASRFKTLLIETSIHPGWGNLFRIAAADAARRKLWTEEVDYAASRCTNPALRQAWSAWSEQCFAKSQCENSNSSFIELYQ